MNFDYLDELRWTDCVELHLKLKDDNLARLLAGLSAAIRHGSEITFIDYGYEWWEIAKKELSLPRELIHLVENEKWTELNQKLEEQEQKFINDIHRLFQVKLKEKES